MISPRMRLALLVLAAGVQGGRAEDCEVSFLQTERTVAVLEKPWLEPAFENVEIPDFMANAAPPPVYVSKSHLSTGGKVGIGVGAVFLVLLIAWAFSEGEPRAEAALGSPVSPNGEPESHELHSDAPHTWRMFIAMMCLWMYLLNYADRYNISVAIIKISEERNYDKRMQGLIQSAVYLGLIPGALTFGHWGSPDVLGPYNALMLACVCWSIATLLTPICADSNLGMLLVIRVALGFFEAGSAPCCFQLSSAWFPKLQTGHMLAASMTGQCAGAALANAFGGVSDWRIPFYIFGACGWIWCGVFLFLGSDHPAVHRYISKEELLAIQDSQREEKCQKTKNRGLPIPLYKLVRHPTVLGILGGEFTFAFLWYFWLSWMPSFFHDSFGLSSGQAGALGMVSYAVGMPAPFLWSKLFQYCFKRNGPSSLLNLRYAFLAVTYLGALAGIAVMLLTYQRTSALFATFVVIVTIASLCAKVVGASGVVVDAGGAANSSRIGGLMQMASAACGSVSNIIIGFFLASPSLGYTGVFVLTLFLALLGLAVTVQTTQVSVIQPSDCGEETESAKW